MELSALRLLLCFLNMPTSSSAGIRWIREPTFDNTLPIAGHNVISRSRIQCGEICSLNLTCVSFFFAFGQHSICQLHDYILSSADGLPTVPKANYYIVDIASQSTKTLSIVYTTLQCPTDDDVFRSVLLHDGSYFTYKMIKQRLTQPDAKTECALQGSFLARVTTVEKMGILLELVNCSGYSGSDYYVDGSNANASNYYAADAWVMSNRESVPMTAHFWGPGYPNHPYTDHCLRMRHAAGYKFDDCDCITNSFYFICEK